MRDDHALLDALARTADPVVVDDIRRFLDEGSDEELSRVNALGFARARALDEDAAIDAFVRGTRLGLFEMSWNVLCPACGGVIAADSSLSGIRETGYHCALCSRDCEAILDDVVEVRFVASRRARAISVHDPAKLPFWDYLRQVFFGSGTHLPVAPRFDDLARRAVVDAAELYGGEHGVVDLVVDQGPLVVFDPVTHTSQRVDVEGDRVSERQDVTIVFVGSPTGSAAMRVRPGPVRFIIRNATQSRILPGVFLLGDALHQLLGDRRPFLTAKRLLCNQTFRSLYQADTVRRDQRLKITSLTFLFTDLRGSTDLYGRVGDIAAYDLVRAHFTMIGDIVASEGGAVVKTIGDAMMAAFPTPERGVSAALRMRESMRRLSDEHATDLVLKIGVHEGPCLAVNLNERQDFFGQTVNIASRIQALAENDAIFISEPVLRHSEAASLLPSGTANVESRTLPLRGVRETIPIVVVSR